MKQYLELVKKVLEEGVEKPDRTGTGVISLFGPQIEFDLREGFPLVTTKKTYWKGALYELLWFLSGSTNNNDLLKNGITIWNEWAKEDGDLGRIYSAQWRDWTNSKGEKTDQIQKVVDQLKTDPYSRRIIVVAFNPGELDQMSLPPCHSFFQFVCEPVKGDPKAMYLSCKLYMRSQDLFLGGPFNFSGYSGLTHMLASVCTSEEMKFIPKTLIVSYGDCHIYKNHVEQCKIMLQREPHPLPTLIINPNIKNINDFKYEDFELKDYKFHPTIKADVSI